MPVFGAPVQTASSGALTAQHHMSRPQAQPSKRRHPGGGRRRGSAKPKGRQVSSDALAKVSLLLDGRSLQRDHLIEYLHLIQDAERQLSADHLVALAHLLRLPLSEVYETATFYAHFDVVRNTGTRPPAVTVRVCDSLSCELVGARSLRAGLATAVGADVRVVRSPCMGRCDQAPAVAVGHHQVDRASVKSVTAAIDAGRTHAEVPAYEGLDAYLKAGGYQIIEACVRGDRSVDEVIDTLSDAGLRGMGGAGFPTGRKWSIVRSYKGPRLMAVNADEGEPGTFKDRYYLERHPHRFLEGVLVAAWAVEAERVYIYLRDEYPAVRNILLAEIAAIEDLDFAVHTRLELRRGAGAYICGEESSMLESIEGKRGLPRNRPPYVAEVGLFGRPTLVQNVETLYWVRDIIANGAESFSRHGRNGGQGLRSFSVSGRVAEPGVKLAPAGISVRELIDEHCGGMAQGHTFKAYLPGGASGGILPASLAHVPLEFGQLERYGAFVGSHAVVVLSEHDDLKAVALNLMRFFEDESCGQCTPCRVGTEKAVKLMAERRWDRALLRELSQVMRDASICGLGQAAANPLLSVLEHFPEELA